MGASGWIYFTPYQPDPAKALAELRQQVYDSGAFYNRLASVKKRIEEALQSGDTSEFDPDPTKSPFPESLLPLSSRLQDVSADLEQQTLATIHVNDDGAGTHSILDIRFITDEEGTWCGAIALPSEVLLEVFGMPQPTHEQVETCYGHYPSPLDPYYWSWTAIYLIVYANEQPSEYCFIGASGD